MNCPRCGSINYCKDGVVKSRQRYKCKDCKYHYTVEQRSNAKSEEIRRLSFEMYLEGLGFRAIGRILKISYGTVFQ
jgi:transposase-like protein